MSTAESQESTRVLPRAVLVVLGLAAAVVVIAGMKASASILGPTFLALLLVVAVHPMRNWLRRKGLPEWATVTIALTAIYAVLLGLVASLVVSVARFATILPQYQGKFDELLGQARRLLGQYGVGDEQVQKALNVDANRVFSVIGAAVGSTVSVLSALLLVATLALFMAADAAGYGRRLAVVERDRPHLVEALRTFSRGTRQYLFVSTVFGLIVAALDVVALWTLGIPLPLLWGLLAFITNYIPNIGFVLGLVPPALLGLLEGGPMTMLIVIVVYSIINFVVQTVIQPKIVGDTAGLSVTLAMTSLIFWGWVLGPLGALLAIPLTLLAKALLVDADPSARWFDVFLASKVRT
ncbi:AI-2E family transporter [Mycolicibacterium sp. BiH015]|uniref:AI-2E family transporter n=1 Tax=Mycolicibacterium sp. BiH015 TaxID=3018808 RepID=UPI0022E45F9F|nr:AI-2E family transporter [Mycolicibacterium sp. BiH015]MDA2892563.1 AI-2E family transporter [Mycolicibacterium sp. BiH015]